MSNRVAPQVTAGPSPEHHVGVNTVFSTYTFQGTASGSQSIYMARIPPGARVTSAILSWNGDISTTTGAVLSVKSWTGSTNNGNLIATAAVSTNPLLYNPEFATMGYRHTASSHAVIAMGDSMVLSGTSTTVFTLMLSYICDQDGD